jgi:hypothetical protein
MGACGYILSCLALNGLASRGPRPLGQLPGAIDPHVWLLRASGSTTEGCTTEGCLRCCDARTHYCGLGTLWPNARGTGYQFRRLVLPLTRGTRRLVFTNPPRGRAAKR